MNQHPIHNLMSSHTATSPSSVGSFTANDNHALVDKDVELQRKRARDRKSQQAMRDRNKWTIHTLTEQVALLSQTLEDRTRGLNVSQERLGILESENAHLRTQNAALQLSLMGRPTTALPSNPWEVAPKNSAPDCLADQILQGFVDSVRAEGILKTKAVLERAAGYSLRPNLCPLLETGQRTDDDISNVVADVVKTYNEIETLPKQVAVFYVMATLLKVRDEDSASTSSSVVTHKL
jgi:hypothetical protein